MDLSDIVICSHRLPKKNSEYVEYVKIMFTFLFFGPKIDSCNDCDCWRFVRNSFDFRFVLCCMRAVHTIIHAIFLGHIIGISMLTNNLLVLNCNIHGDRWLIHT